jgi:hypothetical protein
MLASLFTLAALDADHGLSVTSLIGADLDSAEGHVKFLIECFGTGLNALQASHALGVFLNSQLFHNGGFSFLNILQKDYTARYRK